MPIYFHKQGTAYRLRDVRKISAWISSIIQSHNKVLGDLNYIICSDDELLEINKSALNHDYYTDIITFNYVEEDVISGDIFISIDRIKDNAKSFKASLKDETHRVLIHGVLHLVGFNDKSDVEAKQMREQEDKSLSLRDF